MHAKLSRRLLAAVVMTSAAVAGIWIVSARAATQGGPSRPLRDVLRDLAEVSDAEWASIERGNPVAKVLDTDSREVAVAGAVRVAAASEGLVVRARDIDNLKRSSLVLDVGRFGAVPKASDLARVSFEEHGLNLRACRPFDCVVRLSEPDIARFEREVNWDAADWRDRSAGLWREVLAGYANAYRRAGRTALPVYANKREPLSVADEVSRVVSDFGFLAAFSPEFLAYLREFLPSAPPGSEQTLYWSKEDFGVRPILRITHQVIHRATADRGTTIIASNQIYADHYLDAAVTVTLAIEGSSEDHGKQFYLVSVSRARTRSLTGLMRSLVRSTVQNRSREALRKMLTSTRTSLEGQTR
jgi:hypothetical protein